MVGRYGDLLAYVRILSICDIFIPGGIAKFAGTLLIIFAIYRMFSKNHSKMRLQLDWYRTYVDGPLRSWLARDRKTILTSNARPASRFRKHLRAGAAYA